jgi:hypothetical protein
MLAARWRLRQAVAKGGWLEMGLRPCCMSSGRQCARLQTGSLLVGASDRILSGLPLRGGGSFARQSDSSRGCCIEHIHTSLEGYGCATAGLDVGAGRDSTAARLRVLSCPEPTP